MGKLHVFALSLLVCCLAPACDKTEVPNDGKRMPNPPPPGSSATNTTIAVSVVIDGAPAFTLDGARLETIKADYAEDERRAWRIPTLVGPSAASPGATIAATGDQGLALTMIMPSDPKAPEPVLVLSRRGEVIVTLADPEKPFPPYHGWGGRLGRPGDPLPRIAGVTRLDVTSPKGSAADGGPP